RRHVGVVRRLLLVHLHERRELGVLGVPPPTALLEIGVARLARLRVRRERARVHPQPRPRAAGLQGGDGGRDAGEQLTVVTDEQHGLARGEKLLLEPPLARHVEVVVGLVEQQYLVRAAQQRLEHQPLLLAARERAHLAPPGALVRDAERGDRADVPQRLLLVAADVGPVGQRLRVGHLHPLGVVLHHRELRALQRGGGRAHRLGRHPEQQVAHRRLVAHLTHHLAHDAEPARADHGALLRREVAGDHAGERRLARAVRPDERDARAVADAQRDVVQQRPPVRERDADARQLDVTHDPSLARAGAWRHVDNTGRGCGRRRARVGARGYRRGMSDAKPSTSTVDVADGPDLRAEATAALRRLVGREDAELREDQWRAIDALVSHRRRALVVQRTGWGKSAVYFVATALLRARGAGPTVIVSPLLALMRDQIAAADRAGIHAVTVNSANTSDWSAIYEQINAGEVDVLLCSTERLNNPGVRDEVLPRLAAGAGLAVVDEAHGISDWGHDFRPVYRPIRPRLEELPEGIPVLATTATANQRVTRDVAEQLGAGGQVEDGEVLVLRGGLDRASLHLAVVRLPDPSTRLAWLAENLRGYTGSGIVYCLTVAAAEQTASRLREAGYPVSSYTGQTEPAEREQLEADLKENRVKALVATSAL